jgi:ATP-dependent Lon protease
VFNLVFPDLDREVANKCKVCEWEAERKKKTGESEAAKEDQED